ncbi:MAG TPA: hypothetical protein VMY42_00290 [Thermoguttaceae bacterium]|nr:hypothetical protein [Thermoguttaceae bacterium]
MKTSLVYLFVLTLVAAVGCSGNSAEGPKPTATPATKQPVEPVKTVVEKPIAGEADETFSLSVPFETVALTQGEEKSVLIGINRGDNFREEVAIEVSDLPMGVTLVTADPVIKQGATDVTLMLKAAGDAALGDFTVKLTGHTVSSGADFTKEFKMTVAEK